MSRASTTLQLIFSFLILLVVLLYAVYRDADCNKKKCPPGTHPYLGWYSSKCLCVVEPK